MTALDVFFGHRVRSAADDVRLIRRPPGEGTLWPDPVEEPPHDGALWAEVRPVAGRFLEAIWRQGAFAGRTADEAYIVRCGTDTMTEEDVEGGHLNVLVGFAPTRPAEFAWIHFTKRWRMTAM